MEKNQSGKTQKSITEGRREWNVRTRREIANGNANSTKKISEETGETKG